MSTSTLHEAFLKDHRRLVGGLTSIVEAVERDDVERAAALATELDDEAGPHMAFEEEVFYPRIAETHGQRFVDRLMAEHEVGQKAIRHLLQLGPGETLAKGDRRQLLADLELALGHALSCGTLLSRIEGDPERDARELAELEARRRSARRWSDRSYSNGD